MAVRTPSATSSSAEWERWSESTGQKMTDAQMDQYFSAIFREGREARTRAVTQKAQGVSYTDGALVLGGLGIALWLLMSGGKDGR